MLTWWFCTFMAPAIKPKIRNIHGLQELFSIIDPGNIQIPGKYLQHLTASITVRVQVNSRKHNNYLSCTFKAYITEHDVTLHGFGAVAYSLNHSSNQTTPKTSNTPQSTSAAVSPATSMNEI